MNSSSGVWRYCIGGVVAEGVQVAVVVLVVTEAEQDVVAVVLHVEEVALFRGQEA